MTRSGQNATPPQSSSRVAFERAAAAFERVRAVSKVERDAAIASACAGDDALAAEVRELLRHHEGENDLLDQAVLQAGAAQIGPYRLERRLGEGGMGTVWLAHQEKPVERRVALKVIKAGMDTRAVVRRFEMERSVLSRLDHPGIARVLDAGVTPDGRPYFAMELVQGDPLLAWCDERRLSVRDRVLVFIDICRAVAHAHTKGVLHRDLKPSNILVTQVDGKPVPKVIDFGVAKALDDRAGEATLLTQVGSIIGTPDYMSPEQATPGGDVDTRSDLFSLGVVLYELLTGTTPRAAARTTSRRGAAMTTIAGLLRGDAPPRPSSALESGSAADIATIAEQRSTDVRSLRRSLRGDLDWIVLRAVATEPARRYETVVALAEDLHRALAMEPIQARPPSFGYVASRFAQRHARSLAAVGLVVLALVGGLAVAIAGWRAARSDRDAARAATIREQATSHALADRLHESLVEQGRSAASAGTLRAARDQLWSALADRPDSLSARWALRELMLRHPCLAGTVFREMPTTCIADARDGRAFIGLNGSPPILMDPRHPDRVQTLDGPPMHTLRVAVSTDGRWAMAANTDGSVHGWDLRDGRWMGSVSDHRAGDACVAAINGARFVTSGADGVLSIVDLDASTREVLSSAPLRAATMAEPVISGRRDEELSALAPPRAARAVTGLVAHPSGSIVAGFADGALILCAPGIDPIALTPHRRALLSMAFSPDGRRIVTACEAREIIVHDALDGGVVTMWQAASGTVRDLAFADDAGSTVVVAGWWEIQAVDVASGAVRTLVPEPAWRFILRDGGRSVLFVTGTSAGIRQWAPGLPRITIDDSASPHSVGNEGIGAHIARTEQPLQSSMLRPPWPRAEVSILTVRDRTLFERDGDGQPRWSFETRARIDTLATSEDRSLHLLGCRDGEVVVVSAEGERRATFDGHDTGQRHAAAIHAGRGLVAFAAIGGGVRVRSMDGSVDRHLLADETGEILSVTFAADGASIFVSARRGVNHEVAIDGSAERSWRTSSTVFATLLMRNGTRLVCGTWRGFLEIFDDRATTPRTLSGHGRLVASLTAHPAEPSLLFTGDVDGIVRVWDVDRGHCLFAFEPFEPATGVQRIALSADGDAVRVVGADGQIAGWSWSDLDARIEANRSFELMTVERMHTPR